MLRRLETDLKAHFDLTREVSKDDDRLRWDLPTFLEMAARKVSKYKKRGPGREGVLAEVYAAGSPLGLSQCESVLGVSIIGPCYLDHRWHSSYAR